jgi:hypothetical protein
VIERGRESMGTETIISLLPFEVAVIPVPSLHVHDVLCMS